MHPWLNFILRPVFSLPKPAQVTVCVFYYCRTYYKAVRVGGGGEWRTCAMRDDEPRPVTSVVLFNIGPVTPNRINGLFDSVKETEPHPY